MIFGHLGLAFLLKAKFYSKSFLWLIIFCYLPDLLFYLFFGMKWILSSDYSPILTGALRPLISITGTSISIVDYSIPLSHSIALYMLFTVFFILGFSIKRRSIVGLIYVVAIFSHLLFDFLLPDATLKVPIVYPFYPFDPSVWHYLPIIWLDASVFWLIDLSVFALGFFMALWAFSKKSGRADIPI